VKIVRVCGVLAGPAAVGGGHLVEEFPQTQGFGVQPEPARVGLCRVLEVVDDVLEQQGLFQQGRDERVVGGGQAVLGRFQPAADRTERGAQFMGDIADHRLALDLHALAALAQVVEGGGQVADLVVGGHRYPLVLLCRMAGGVGQRSQGADQPGADGDRDGQGGDENERGDTGDPGRVGRREAEAGLGRSGRSGDEQQHGRSDVPGKLLAAGGVDASLDGLVAVSCGSEAQTDTDGAHPALLRALSPLGLAYLHVMHLADDDLSATLRALRPTTVSSTGPAPTCPPTPRTSTSSPSAPSRSPTRTWSSGYALTRRLRPVDLLRRRSGRLHRLPHPHRLRTAPWPPRHHLLPRQPARGR